MGNEFDLRKFLTENKNITEDKFADAAEEDLIQCVKNLANTRYIDPVEAADEAIAIIEKTFLTNDEDEDMYEGEDLDEENRGDYGWFYRFRRMIPGTKEWQETLDSLTKGTPLDKPYSRKGVKKK